MKSLLFGIISVFIALPSYAFISVSPSSMSFSTKVGMSMMNTAFVNNQNNKRVSVYVNGFCQEFTVQHNCYTLSPYSSCSIHVTYRPTKPGMSNCSISVRDSVGGFASLSAYGNANQ